MIEEDSEKQETDSHLNSDIDDDSLDEGVGDISCDETNDIFVPEDKVNKSTINSDLEISAKNPENIDMESNNTAVLPGHNEKERRPSRISFETPL